MLQNLRLFHKIQCYDEEMQILMEKSALVIIDMDDAIANGYVKLTKVVEDLIAEDDGEGNGK